MGRGLSDLQKAILQKALDNRKAEGLKPIEYGVYFENMDHIHQWPKDSPETLAWRTKLKEAGANSPPDRELFETFYPGLELPPFWELGWPCIRGSDVSIAIDHKNPWRTRDEATERASSLSTALGVRAWVEVESVWHSDLYLWEVLESFYGFGEHRKTFSWGTADTRYPAHVSRPYSPRRAPQNEQEKAQQRLCEAIHIAADKKRSAEAGKRIPGGKSKLFARSEIGVERYNSARVSVTKAFARLQERGFAEVFHWRNSPGIKLTLQGVETAEGLLATRPDIKTTGSQ